MFSGIMEAFKALKIGKSILPNPWILLFVIVLMTGSSTITGYYVHKNTKAKYELQIQKIENAVTLANANLIQKFNEASQSSMVLQDQLNQKQQQIDSSREKIITKYITKWKDKPSVCAVDSDTSQAINEILQQ